MENTVGNSLCKCGYCGNYHNYSPEMCKDMNKITVGKIELGIVKPCIPTPPLSIPDNTNQLQQIIDLLKEIRYNTDRLRAK
jgi:hypothetical protein